MRLEISKRTDQALRALRALGGDAGGHLVAGSVLAATIDTSVHYLPQIMRPLVTAGWVVSTPGPSGGYRGTVPLSEIAILDVVEAIEGPTDNGRCVLKGAPCHVIEACAMHEAWTRARGALLKELGATPVEADAVLPEREGNDDTTQQPRGGDASMDRTGSARRGVRDDRDLVQRRR